MFKIKSYFSLHYSFVLLIAFSFFTQSTILLLMYFICLVFHEMAHGFIAKKLGYKIGKIKLFATGAVLQAEGDEFSFSDEVKIAIAGPLFNLCFSLLLIVLWWIIPESYNFTMDLCVVNFALFAFNMLPIFPLDGGRILLALISKKSDRLTAVKITKSVAMIFSFLLFCLFIISCFEKINFNLGLMAITLFIGCVIEDKDASYKRCFYFSRKQERTKKCGVEVRYLCVNKDLPKTKLLKFLDARHFTIFVLVGQDLNPVQTIKENELIDMFTQK